MTAPPLKAAFSAPCRPTVAAWAVRTLAMTAMRMPMNPAASEQTAPMRKPTPVEAILEDEQQHENDRGDDTLS